MSTTFYRTDLFIVTSAVVYYICCPFLVLLTVVHIVNVVSDLCTNKRVSVRRSFDATNTDSNNQNPPNKVNKIAPSKQKKQQLPKITFVYKLSGILSIVAMTGYCIALVILCICIWRIFSNLNKCALYVVIGISSYSISRSCMYQIFLLRLHIVYGDTKYAYNIHTLFIISIINLILCIGWTIATVFYMDVSPYVYNEYLINCGPQFPWILFLISGVYDIIMCTTCLIAFTSPLHSVIKWYLQSFDVEDTPDISLEHLIKTGTKAEILASSAVITTIIGIAGIAALNTLIFMPIDAIINSVCLALLTTYYDIYYDRICCGCIKWNNYLKITFVEKFKNKKNKNVCIKDLTRHHTRYLSATIPYLESTRNITNIKSSKMLHVVTNNSDDIDNNGNDTVNNTKHNDTPTVIGLKGYKSDNNAKDIDVIDATAMNDTTLT